MTEPQDPAEFARKLAALRERARAAAQAVRDRGPEDDGEKLRARRDRLIVQLRDDFRQRPVQIADALDMPQPTIHTVLQRADARKRGEGDGQ